MTKKSETTLVRIYIYITAFTFSFFSIKIYTNFNVYIPNMYLIFHRNHYFI
jgi:hypothetical protein